jgi:hypothetical protein
MLQGNKRMDTLGNAKSLMANDFLGINKWEGCEHILLQMLKVKVLFYMDGKKRRRCIAH